MDMKTRKKMKIRKSVRYAYILLAIILLLISSSCLSSVLFTKDTKEHKREIYSYTNKFNYDYTVNLSENIYIDERTLGMDKTGYVTDLIDNINMNLNYTYSSKLQTDVTYQYKIVGKLEAVYSKDGVSHKILEKEYALTEEKILNSKEAEYTISENIVLDLKEQNELVKDFEQKMGITVSAKYVVGLEMITNTNIEQEEIENEYNPTISIDLGEKITTIQGENDKVNTEYIVTNVTQDAEISVMKILLYSFMLLISVAIIVYICTKTEPANRIRDEFKQELNRILKLCQDKIVKVNSDLDIDKINMIDVKDFGEVLKVSEELFKPILYWYSVEKEEAWFYVMADQLTYCYILKKGS